ncbi:MAG: GNAT family N-acetyltransferase [Pseudorhodobacter sp.]|nr:GNAT family N-acetyltransferase [Frankiaceae bacterium]
MITSRAPAEARIETDRDVLERLGPRLDDLQQRTLCPVTARRLWQQTWLDHVDVQPLVTTIVGADGDLRAAAVLAVRPGPVARVVPVGDGPSDEVRLPALTPADAILLARAVAAALCRLRRPWLLAVRHLDPADSTVAALEGALRWGAVTPGDASPRLVLGQDRSVRAHVSRNHHQQVRRMRNRLARDGLVPLVQHLRTPTEVVAVWPEVERVCRARDEQLRGRSTLDDRHTRDFVRTVVPLLAARDEVRLTTLRLDGRLAAYVLCFRDGSARRMWNCRLDPELQAYGVGRIANDEALQDALADPSCALFDWMRGEEPYKASMSDHVHRAVDLVACSSPALWAGVLTTSAVRRRLRQVRDGGGVAGRLVLAAEPTLHRLDRVR